MHRQEFMDNPRPVNDNFTEALRREAERIEEDATFSSKSHFNAEHTWIRRHYLLGIPATALAAIAGAALFKNHSELASIFAMTASLLSGLMTFLKPNERAALHRSSAGNFLALRNNARYFREIEIPQAVFMNDISEKLGKLLATRNELNQSSPSIPLSAFASARKGIEQGEATHKVDKKD